MGMEAEAAFYLPTLSMHRGANTICIHSIYSLYTLYIKHSIYTLSLYIKHSIYTLSIKHYWYSQIVVICCSGSVYRAGKFSSL